MPNIILKEKNFLGKGSYAEVYRYKLKNIDFAVKCFKEKEYALKESNILEGIKEI